MAHLGLIGYPLSHSFSPAYFTALFEREQRPDLAYRLYPLEDIKGLPDLIAEHPDLRGFNVTIPHKRAVMDYLNRLDESAAETGAVNTVTIERNAGRLILTGYNTDVHGFTESLKPLLRAGHKGALVLGYGGAAQAVICGLKKLGIPYRIVSRRNGPYLGWQDLTEEVVSGHTIVVNTTPVGMYPAVEEQPPFPVRFLGPSHLVYDLIYNPEKTALLEAAEKQGAVIKNGLQMLHLQAEKAWTIFKPLC